MSDQTTAYGDCAIKGCGPSRQRLRRGYCGKHYTSLWKYGDPLTEKHRRQGSDPYNALLVRGHTRVGECFIYNGQKGAKGYGIVWFNNKSQIPAHKVSYEKWHGPVPPGLVIDHICHNEAATQGLCDGGNSCVHRACINPAHLRAVTAEENQEASPLSGRGRRPTGMGLINSSRTHCVRGHPFEGDNLIIYTRPNGKTTRVCRACRKIYNSRARET